MFDLSQRPLTRVVKRLLDVCQVLAIASLIIWPLVVAAMALSQKSHPATWGVDIGVFSGFIIDLNAMSGDVQQSTGVREPIIRGKADLSIDTSSVNALYLFTAITEVAGIVGLYVLIQLRALFASLAGGVSFTQENSTRIKRIGLVLLTWAVVNPILQYFGGRSILSEYSLGVTGIELTPAFELSGLMIFVGLAMLVLSGVLNEAASIHEDQQLTI